MIIKNKRHYGVWPGKLRKSQQIIIIFDHLNLYFYDLILLYHIYIILKKI